MPEGPTTKLGNPERPTPNGHDESAAERKRREARRRLLLGGAAALPVVLSVKRANAMNTWTQCADLVQGEYGPPIFADHWSQYVPWARDIWGSFATFPSICVETMEEADSSSGT